MQINYIDDNSSERLPEPESFDNIFANIGELRELQHIHTAAMMQLRLKFEILNSEFRVHHHLQSDFIILRADLNRPEACTTNLFSAASPRALNLQRRTLTTLPVCALCAAILTMFMIWKICFCVNRMLGSLKRTDYIKNPNFNGYRSLHLDVEIPVYLSSKTEYARAEIQLRTVAMDFWASLEHDLRYKSTKNIPEDISREMFNCADEIAAIDVRMQRIYKQIQKL